MLGPPSNVAEIVGPIAAVVIVAVVVAVVVTAIVITAIVYVRNSRKQRKATVRGGMYCTVVIVTV